MTQQDRTKPNTTQTLQPEGVHPGQPGCQATSELQAARKILAEAAARTPRRRHRRLFLALVAQADTRLAAAAREPEDRQP